MLRTASRLHSAAGRLIQAVEYEEPGIHRSELTLFALLLTVAVASVWIGKAI
jgi:hypothetical protein